PALAIARSAPSLAGVPEEVFIGLLHASAERRPVLSAETAIALVLRAQSPGFARLPSSARSAALRLFCAGQGDARGAALERLLALLPREWRLSPEGALDLVAAAGRARVGLADASALCARLAASIAHAARGKPGVRLGGLAQLE